MASSLKKVSLGKNKVSNNPHSLKINLIIMSDIQNKVTSIIVDQLDVNEDQVTLEAKFIEYLGADSLDVVELVMAFEEEFDIEVPEEDAEKLLSVGDVVTYIEEVS